MNSDHIQAPASDRLHSPHPWRRGAMALFVVAVLAAVIGVATGAGAAAPNEVTGTIVRDINANGSTDTGEPRFAGVVVQLLDGSNQVVASATTDPAGNYAIDSDTSGTYTLKVVYPSGFYASAGLSTPATGKTPVSITAGVPQTVDIWLRPDPVLHVAWVGAPVDGSAPFTPIGTSGCTSATATADPGGDCGPDNSQIRTNETVAYNYDVTLNSSSGQAGSVTNNVLTHTITQTGGAVVQFASIPFRCTPAGGGGSNPASSISTNATTGAVTLTCNLGTMTMPTETFFSANVLVNGKSAPDSTFTSTVTVSSSGSGSDPTQQIAVPDSIVHGPLTVSAIAKYNLSKNYTPLVGGAYNRTINGATVPGRNVSFIVQVNNDQGPRGGAALADPITFSDIVQLKDSAGNPIPSTGYTIVGCSAGAPVVAGGVTNDAAFNHVPQPTNAVYNAGACSFTGGDGTAANLSVSGAETVPPWYPTIDLQGNPLPAAEQNLVISYTVTVFVPLTTIDTAVDGVADHNGSLTVGNCITGFDPSTIGGAESNYGAGTEPTTDNCGQSGLVTWAAAPNAVTGTTKFYRAADGGGFPGGIAGEGLVGRGQQIVANVSFSVVNASVQNYSVCDAIDTQTQTVTGDAYVGSGTPDPFWVVEYSAAPNPGAVLEHDQAFNPATGRWEIATDAGWNAYRSTTCGDSNNWASTQDGPWYTTRAAAEADSSGTGTITRVRVRPADPNADLSTGLRFLRIPVTIRSTFVGGPHDGQPIPDGQTIPDIAVSSLGGSPWSPAAYNPVNRTGGNGDEVIVESVRVGVDKISTTPAELPGNTTPAVQAGTQIIWNISPKVTGLIGAATQNATNVVVVDDLPVGASYDAGCTAGLGSQMPSSVAADTPSAGRTRLTWNLGTLPVGTSSQLQVCVSTSPYAANNTDLVNHVSISSPSDPGGTGDGGPQNLDHTDDDTVRLQQLGGVVLNKTVDQPLDERDRDQKYTMNWVNTSATVVIKAPTFIDVFPHNGDDTTASGSKRFPGSDFHGTLQLTAEPVPNRPGTLTYTADDPLSVNQVPAQNTSTWCALTGGTYTYQSGPGTQADCPATIGDVTAFRFVEATDLAIFDPTNQTTAGNDRGSIAFTLQAGDAGQAGQVTNAAGDRYTNRFGGQSPSFDPSSFLISNAVVVRVVGFELGDLVFTDENGDGKYDPAIDTLAPAGVTLNLVDAAGAPVINPITGAQFTATTDSHGRYLFTDLPAGTYRVQIPASQFAAGAPLAGWSGFPAEADPAANLNEEGDAHGVAGGGGIITGPVTFSYDPATGLGNGPLNDQRPDTPTLSQLDSFTNLTLDIRLQAPAPAAPAITIVKSINGDDANTAPGVAVATGSAMNIAYLVTNTGDVTLNRVTVTDDKVAATDISCPQTTLAPGEQMTCTATAPAPAVGTVHTDTGTVVGTPPANRDGSPAADVTDTDPANAFAPAAPAITIVKSINDDDANTAPGVKVNAGSTLSIKYLVTNTGDVTLDPVTVSDDQIAAADISCPQTTLAPGEQMTCTATAPAPAPGNVHTDTGTVVGTPPANLDGSPVVPVTATDPANAYVPAQANLTFTKTLDGPATLDPSGVYTIHYYLTVANPSTAVTGSYALSDAPRFGDGITLQSANIVAIAPAGPVPVDPSWDGVTNLSVVIGQQIAPGEMQVYRVTATATVGTGTTATSIDCAIDAGENGTGFLNLGVFSTNGKTQFATACDTPKTNPAVSIVKSINGDDANTAPGVEVAAGSTMDVTFLVTNTGDVTLDPVTVTDDKIAATDISCPKATLAAGEQMTCTATAPAPAPGAGHVDTGTVVGTRR